MAIMSNSLIVTDIVKRYEASPAPVTVLDGVSLHAEPGDTIAILGPSGSGKSTLLNIIGSLDTPTSGSVQLGEIAVTGLSGNALTDYRARRVGFVFQDHHLLPQLTALENVMLPTLAVKERKDSAHASRLLERLGIAHRAEAFPAQMSGGERQRVAIARALINGAGLLLCDEPTGNLDRETGTGIVTLFLELAREESMTIIMVTHNHDLATRLHHSYELRGGQLHPIIDQPASGGRA
ncbi:MAG: ABC transporter ATP-binding protein [Armatimonadota bacterium]